jgi:hypothetical protein
MESIKSKVYAVNTDPIYYDEEFNEICLIVQRFVDELSTNKNTDSNHQFSTITQNLKKLQTNSYFHYMFISNQCIKELFLKNFQLILNHLPHIITGDVIRIELFNALKTIISLEFNKEKCCFTNDEVRLSYLKFFQQIIPSIEKNLDQLRGEPSKNNITFLNPIMIDSMTEILCYIFYSTSFNDLIESKFLPAYYDLILNLPLSPLLNSKLLSAIAINFCSINMNEKSGDVSEVEKLEIYQKCSAKTIDLMEMTVQNINCRKYLKIALDKYCTFITSYITKMENGITIDEQDDTSLLSKWRYTTHLIIIKIVKIIRQEFEMPMEAHLAVSFVYFFSFFLKNLTFFVFKSQLISI